MKPDSDLDPAVIMRPAELLELEVPQQKHSKESSFMSCHAQWTILLLPVLTDMGARVNNLGFGWGRNLLSRYQGPSLKWKF